MTQKERILRHFNDFGSITAAEAMNEYGIYRLASRISDLKREGYTIHRTMVKGKIRYGEQTCFAEYRLENPHEQIPQ